MRDRCATAIAINWHPQEELGEFLSVADRLLGKGDGKVAEEIGATGARVNLRHLGLRLATGMKRLETVHVECRDRGGERCVWQLRWAG